jgi:hypothetical protein
MKNKPQRERPKLRSRSSYNRKRKRAYEYPEWVRNGNLPTLFIRHELLLAHMQAWKVPATSKVIPAWLRAA